MTPQHYLPADIERTSMSIITEELAQRRLEVPPENAAVVKRVIHTTADFDYAQNLHFTPAAVAAGIAAMHEGVTIITDTNMALAGITKPGLAKLGGQVMCFMADPAVAAAAKEAGTTRAVAAMHKAAQEYPRAVLAVGNAPTALLAIAEEIENGLRPALVIGVPVGFVNVVESKERLFATCGQYGVPAIVAMGRKGGSNVAAAICNALLYQAAEMLDPKARGLYANIPDVGVKKLNAACAYGGGPLVVRTIEDNYKLPIDNYASVDFDSMIDIIDAIGGIELSPSDDEIRVANQYVDEMCRLRNVDASAHQYTAGGEQHVDGYQAVAYARIRYVGNSDYQRTERQREVLSKMMQKMKSSSVTELSALADTILPSVTHNIDQSTLMTLIGELPTILSYEIVQSRVPYDDLYSSKGEMLVPDFAATILDYNDTRKLVVENPDACVRYFLVKPSDVAIYVEHGAADIGIVGKDILTESGADVYELLDTGMGKCRMCVAGPAGFTDDESRALRVATKFVNIARDHYERRGRDIDIVKLNGSIELAPILGLSDVIVDIVETGTTLKENDLTVIEEFMPISARFIANKASYKFKYAQLTELLNKMKEALAK